MEIEYVDCFRQNDSAYGFCVRPDGDRWTLVAGEIAEDTPWSTF